MVLVGGIALLAGIDSDGQSAVVNYPMVGTARANNVESCAYLSAGIRAKCRSSYQSY